MSAARLALRHDLAARAAKYGISVNEKRMKDDAAGEFDGPTIHLNQHYESAEQTMYLAHAIGSIAEWSLHFNRSRQTIDQLQTAKRKTDETALRRALASYLGFEERTWERSAWLLVDLGYHKLVPEFTVFGRADLESMRIMHMTGSAPMWRDFYDRWKEEVSRGTRNVKPFAPRPIAPFQAVPIPKQEIVQEDAE
jgi:hypothetical protein